MSQFPTEALRGLDGLALFALLRSAVRTAGPGRRPHQPGTSKREEHRPDQTCRLEPGPAQPRTLKEK